ncbi:hypothetical protein L1049_015872 [Liquidambar formosana]|uniref:K Homology domain-containing protein n=1 Tax=Liquidambar formosana TaxID=63359 RepID=A0AAP0RYG6_LIQFO
MEGSFLSPPAKRSIYIATGMPDPNPYTANGSSKRSKPPPRPLSIPPGHVAFRLLCHASRIGGLIGKSGTIIKQLQQATSAKIRVEDAPHDSSDRVIVVVASSAIKATKLSLTVSSEENGRAGEEVEASAAQEALLRVFERTLDVAAESDGVGVAVGGVVSCRLLAETSQVGSVIGKGGKVVEKIRKDSGCKIRVLSGEKLPACAGPTEEMVEIEGDVLAVKKALVAVSRRLQDCSLVDKTKMIASKPLEAVPRETLPDLRVDLPLRSAMLPPVQSSSISYASGGRPLSIETDRFPTLETKNPQEEVIFRILCSNDRVGGVIGKGGTIVRALQNETGASISVGASVAECDERLITVTASENTELRYSPAQKAVVLIFSRSVEAGIEKGLDSSSNKRSPVTARLVVPSNQVGCLLGKGGTIISEMRKVTGAGIRIIGGDQVPKCASENDEVVQISGEFVNVQDAVYHVTGRLRDNLFPSKPLNDAGTRSGSSVITEISPYGRVRDPASLGLQSSVGISHSLNRHTSLTQSMDHLGLSRNLDHPTSPRSWASQTIAGVNSRGVTDIGRGLTSLRGGIELGSGSRSAIVTNTTVEIVVPENVIGSVYGENGSNLARLRQISGAKVTVHEPRPGTRERIIVISGTPDETQAAQSLLQAFILTGSS